VPILASGPVKRRAKLAALVSSDIVNKEQRNKATREKEHFKTTSSSVLVVVIVDNSKQYSRSAVGCLAADEESSPD
jgi:hypothetical protein